MIPTLYVMVGIPGSGKSTFIHKYLSNYKCVSRNIIRLLTITDVDTYFAKEDIVFKQYIQEIKNTLTLGNDVVADATHISGGSRRKLIHALGKIDYNLVFIVMATDFKICNERNNNRTGLAKVPQTAMDRMYSQFTYPRKEDFKNCKGVWIINGC